MRASLLLRCRIVGSIVLCAFAIPGAPASETSAEFVEAAAGPVDVQLARATELLATDFDAGLAELRRAAESKRPNALYLLGSTLFYNVGTEEARREGVQLLVASAELGNPDAQLSLATLHTLGDGVEQDYSAAFELTRSAAASGHPMAHATLAQIYLRGDRSVRRDPVLAFAHAGVAVSLGLAGGHTVRVNAGRLLTAEQKNEARELAEESIADLKTLFPDRFTTLEYRAGIDHLLPDDVKAVVSRAEGGDVDAMMALAELFTSDLVVPMDFDAVVDWTRRAAMRGHFEALRILGSYYLYGTYVSQDALEAYVYLSVADTLGGEVPADDLAKARRQIDGARRVEADRRVREMIKTVQAAKAGR